jgi:3-dehydroquinate dehydratase
MKKIDLLKPNVVAVVSSEADLAQAIEFKKTDADFVEIRVDAGLGRLTPWLPKIKLPIIITVRDKSEGGFESLAPWQRAHLFLEYLPFASFIDIELKQIHDPEFKQVIQEL